MLNTEFKVPFDSQKDQNVNTFLSNLLNKPWSNQFSPQGFP